MKKKLAAKVRSLVIPKIIPPKSLVKLVKADKNTPSWKNKIGKYYRVGYYSPQDGLGIIWLVDENGTYCETTDRDFLLKYFEIIRLSKTKNYFGVRCSPIGPIKEKDPSFTR